MTHTNPVAFLAALQLADSFFPTGAYAHSQGLEGMVRRGLVTSAEGVEEFVRNSVASSLIPADGVALLNAHRATVGGDAELVVEIDRALHALKLAGELRAASRQVGRRLLTETAAFVEDAQHGRYRAAVVAGEAPGHGAVALGVIAAVQGLPSDSALLAFCHNYAVGVLGSAMRLLPVTHTQVQVMLHRLHPVIAREGRRIRHRRWQQMRSFAPELDLVAIGHETDDLRMFAS
jgi:urease accessory protein